MPLPCLIDFVAFAALGTSSAAVCQEAQPKPVTASAPILASQPQITEDVRFRNEGHDRMTVAVRLSGEGPFQFMVDTGADRSAISSELAAKLGLVRGAQASLHSVTGVSDVATATIPDLLMTRRPFRIDNAALLESANIGADGILGVDSLQSQRVTFDFKAQTLSVSPSANKDFSDDPDAIVVIASRKKGRLVVTNAEADGHDLTIVIDTGSQVSIGNGALREQLLRRGVAANSQKVLLQSVTGDNIPGDYMFVRDLKIGGVTLHNLAVVFADAHTFKQLDLDRRPALLLGMNAIRAFKKVSIDFATRKFKVVLPETSMLEERFALRLR